MLAGTRSKLRREGSGMSGCQRPQFVCLGPQDRDFFLKAVIRHRPLVLVQVGPQTARSHPEAREADPRGVTRGKARSRSGAAGQQHFGSARPWIVPTWPRPLVNQRLLTMNV